MKQIMLARATGQGRLLFTEGAEPGKPVGSAAQLGEMVQLREMLLKERQKAPSDVSIAIDGTGAQSGCQGLDMSLKNLLRRTLPITARRRGNGISRHGRGDHPASLSDRAGSNAWPVNRNRMPR